MKVDAETQEVFKGRKAALDEKVKQLRKELRQAEKAGRRTLDIEWEIKSLQSKGRRLYGARAYPIRFSNGLVVDGGLCKQWMKKLPTGLVQAQLQEDSTRLEPDLRISLKHISGKQTFLLVDQSRHYRGVPLPKGEAFLEELGIELQRLEG